MDPDDILIATIGDRKKNIFPTQEDLNEYRDLLHRTFPKGFRQPLLIVPDIIKFTVISKKGRGKRTLKDLVYETHTDNFERIRVMKKLGLTGRKK